MENKVFFREPQFNVENTYHALDVSVHAAAWEEFGMTVLESMACGVPVVASSRVGAAELITGEALQFVLPEPSVEAMAAAMLELAREKNLRARLSLAMASASAPYTLAAHGRALAAYYAELLKK
jgi:UDP-glucose:(heptosyl)LPS alpha-1,3-glucosyltransferase